MPIERDFLDWDGPALSKAARWLTEHRPARGGTWDLGALILVVPGGRARRRLLEILIEHAQGKALVPPQIVTLGELPELLYQPQTPVADDLHAILARMHALRQADPQRLHQVVRQPPADDDLAGWLALAQTLENLHQSLAAERLGIADVAPRLAEAMPDFAEEQRWDALAALQQAYEQTLADHGRQDRHAARLDALEHHQCAVDSHVVLIAAADLTGVARAMLAQAAQRAPAAPESGRITALIHAPAALADAFDELGALVVDRWAQRPLTLDARHIHVVDRPRDQAYQVLRALEALGPDGPYAADQITVGLGDEALGSMVERTLELAGLPVRAAAGRSLAVAPAVILLRTLARFAASLRFDDLAALVRHADVETYLADQLGPIDRSREDWLTLLDRYATDTLQRKLTGSWLGEPARRADMKRVYDAVLALLPADRAQVRPLGEWSQPIVAALTAVYGRRDLRRHDDDDQPLVRTLEALGEALRQQAALDPRWAITPRVNFSEAIALTLSRLAGATIPQEGGRAAVELLGWLELQLDDAPALIITGVNEGAVPQSRGADAFLPDGARARLGLPDNQRRLARDRMALEAILHSRRHVRLIAGRRGPTDEPLKPSRLLLMGDEQDIAARIEMFYPRDPAHEQPDEHPALLLLSPATESRFSLPLPQPVDPPLDRLAVTAFADYLQCPYRFYLKHVLKLKPLDDRAVEMDGGAFGNLAHDVLSAFGHSDLTDSTDPQRIADFFSAELDALVRNRFGATPPTAIAIQREQMRERLTRFALQQAIFVTEGWRVLADYIEHKFTVTLQVDDQPFTITGCIDRIDRHDVHGYRVIDYKTADAASKPQQKHQRGPKDAREWIDLQLPLYGRLVAEVTFGATMELGYVQLPKKLSDVRFDAAPWTPDDLDDAYEKALQIIRDIRANKFWSPGDPPVFADGLGRICMDDCLDREHAINAATRLLMQREGGR